MQGGSQVRSGGLQRGGDGDGDGDGDGGSGQKKRQGEKWKSWPGGACKVNKPSRVLFFLSPHPQGSSKLHIWRPGHKDPKY